MRESLIYVADIRVGKLVAENGCGICDLRESGIRIEKDVGLLGDLVLVLLVLFLKVDILVLCTALTLVLFILGITCVEISLYKLL